ncbi:unknown protein [Parachlamydia acanthamoebae UV-7]|jgi:hypothetical protein|uniref:Uncharacterized protein n=1 Tax=Parachlamydia acanthamoebae (strain UV7) TaxID=765952 RepID=F8KW00_PARAV|nr:unknown protein [Parachlamydia acanthamoebae UV-7]
MVEKDSNSFISFFNFLVGSNFFINPFESCSPSYEYKGVIDIVVKASKAIYEQALQKVLREK